VHEAEEGEHRSGEREGRGPQELPLDHEDGAEIRARSGQLESVEGPGPGSRRCAGGQAEVGEDLGDHGGMFEGGDDLQGAAGAPTSRDRSLRGRGGGFIHLLPRDSDQHT
jgi:hypothetical protein